MLASLGVGAVRHPSLIHRRSYQSIAPLCPLSFSAPRPPSSLSLFFRPSLRAKVAPLPSCRATRSYSSLMRGDGWTLIRLILRNVLSILVFAFYLAVLRLLFSVFPSDFRSRWEALVWEEATCPDALAVPPCVWQAVVAAEDRRFFRHGGVDSRGIARAVLSFTTHGGGSTIAQQLVKNALLRNECRWARKVVEGLVALCLEKKMSKWQILSAYLRRIYWGHGVYGINSASAFYFGKHPSSLSLGESALLAGIIPSPEILSPFKDLSRSCFFKDGSGRNQIGHMLDDRDFPKLLIACMTAVTKFFCHLSRYPLVVLPSWFRTQIASVPLMRLDSVAFCTRVFLFSNK